ncbi:MarR family winged helix-turn-helix transcriptional regulator [Rhizobium sp. C1]|uniref:MarR family winged helix-turn-helix transcriptional regulator n=1 Tax=Rhizobium sp. C1 TaxID=1349799 RepID=UPI001E328564|nr:MarR family winged helix-turn-helix transcriptional regulator [Rhizobium sp. C1]MCD2179793.1 MarR family winged helix-turn-helix transcriptional regulator [Rhizobium sp. C1]
MIEPESIGFLIVEVARLQRTEFEKRIATAGFELTPGEARALLNIGNRSGCRQNEIAEKMGVEPMTMSGYIDKLESLGLAERMPDPTDRRARNVILTPKAEPMLAEIRRMAKLMLADMVSELGEGEREGLLNALKALKISLLEMSAARDAA